MKTIILLDIPVIHDGYIRFFEKARDQSNTLYILDSQLREETIFLGREIRSISPELVCAMVSSLGIFEVVELLGPDNIHLLDGKHIITTQESVIDRFLEQHHPQAQVTRDSVFLRWDEKHVKTETSVQADTISTSAEDACLMLLAAKQAESSSCWWRQVGAVITTPAGQVITLANNEHMPTPQSNYALGDIRDFIPAGTNPEISSAIHAEKNAIALAARRGLSLEGSSIYVTVFPCSDCARIIVKSGIEQVYYASGHATFDGFDILKSAKIKVIFVPIKNNP